MSRENLIPNKGKSAASLSAPKVPLPTSPPPKSSKSGQRKRGRLSREIQDASSDIVIQNVTQLEERKGSLPLAQLNDDEKEFFELLESGDVAKVERFLNEHRALNVNCVNYAGQSALYIAIKNENEDLVKLLFQRSDLEVRDAVLLSVETRNIDFTLTILEAIQHIDPEFEKRACRDSPNFSPDITPLILAAQRGDFKMVRMFLERGHEIDKPHVPNCLCTTCKTQLKEAGPSQSSSRLNVYRAICNPSYICQVTNDPILYGFLLDAELKECSLMDKEFRSDYEALGESVRTFTVTLISQCRNTSEIDTLLKLPFGFDIEHERAEFPRLQLAIDYHQKEFVAHSMVQQVLTAHWLGEFLSWPRISFASKCVHVLMRIFLLPFICFALMFVPRVNFLRKYRSPLNRFLMNLASYLLFLLCVFLLNYQDTGKFKRGPPSTGFEGIIVVFVLGFVWSTFRRYWADGAKRFFRMIWNWYDIAIEGFFLVTFFFWIRSAVDVMSDHVHRRKALDRKFWNHRDSTLLHEGFLAIATVLTFGKLAYYCLQSSMLGPLQVSLGKMAIQIGYFLALCLLINTSFAVPLTRMYAYYDGMTQTTARGETRTQLPNFSTLKNSFFTLFWGMFGMSPVESTDVVIENLTEDKKNPVVNQHDFTAGVGLTLFAIYELMMVIALVNTLIAILSNTFQKIIDNSDVEFKFARTKLWMYFFDDSTLIPSPFNLLPTLGFITSCANYCKALSHQIPGAQAKFSFRRCCYIEYKDKTEVDSKSYEALMSNIIQRYFRATEQSSED